MSTPKQVIGSRCTCGHEQTKHKALDTGMSQKGGQPVTEDGHGPCSVPGCSCGRYTWAENIYQQDEDKSQT